MKLYYHILLLIVGGLLIGCASPHRGEVFNGTIQTVDLSNHQFTVSPLTQSPPVVFHWNNATHFWRNGVPIQPDELQVLKSVRIHYRTVADQHVAFHVYLEVPYAPEH